MHGTGGGCERHHSGRAAVVDAPELVGFYQARGAVALARTGPLSNAYPGAAVGHTPSGIDNPAVQ